MDFMKWARVILGAGFVLAGLYLGVSARQVTVFLRHRK